jgi:syntaxin 8
MQIGDELDGQVMLLDEVEEGVDRHTAQFRRARGRLDRFSRKARENWSLTVIVVLICILLLLIIITKGIVWRLGAFCALARLSRSNS